MEWLAPGSEPLRGPIPILGNLVTFAHCPLCPRPAELVTVTGRGSFTVECRRGVNALHTIERFRSTPHCAYIMIIRFYFQSQDSASLALSSPVFRCVRSLLIDALYWVQLTLCPVQGYLELTLQ